MKLAARSTDVEAPVWAERFLRDACSTLQHRLDRIGRAPVAPAVELESICLWNTLLNAVEQGPQQLVVALESLQVLHARITARTERGGVEDISLQVEYLIRAVLVDRLQSQTDCAVRALRQLPLARR